MTLFLEPKMALCGNGVVEEGEECDCGWEEDCEEECCWPQRTNYPPGEKPCTLRPRKLCSPTQVMNIEIQNSDAIINNLWVTFMKYNIQYLCFLNRDHVATTIVPSKQERLNAGTTTVVEEKVFVMEAPHLAQCQN